MINFTHLRYEILRTVRNGLFLGVTLALPLVLYLTIGSANRHVQSEGVPFPLYFMTGMASYGALFAVFSPGARIARDRASGWVRQLRITPMRPDTYLLSKVVTAYLVALPSLAVLYLAGTALGVRLSAAAWLKMTGLLLVGLLPFVAMGVVVGHITPPDALPGAIGGTVVLFALLGGFFGDFFTSGAMLTIVKLLPSYWLVGAARTAGLGGGWPAQAWYVLSGWTVLAAGGAFEAYRRDTARV